MFEVIFLGTSASTPSVHRSLSAHIVLHRQYRFLIDAGEGTQQQILRSGLGFKRLDKILLTHGHLDHILGLGGLISTLARWEIAEKIEIYGGQSALERVYDLIYKVALRGAKPPVELEFVPLSPGMVIMQDDKFSLSAFPVTHRGSGCFGFVFEERTYRPFLPAKADELGVPVGPERGKLVKGIPITLANGRTIQPEDVLGAASAGTKYVHIGDVAQTEELQTVCQDAHALTIEATYLSEDQEMARQYGHVTAAEGAQLAQKANVGSLILTHLSRRYYERDVVREARSIFPHTFVARDLDHFQVTREGATCTRPLTKTQN